MISRISEKAVDMLFSHSDPSKEDRELYIYGFFMLLSKVFYFLLTVLFGALFGIVINSILFFTMFSVLRSYAGGVHASRENICIIFTTLSLLGSVAVIKIFINFSLIIVPSSLLIFSTSAVWLLCPLDTESKRLTREERKEYKKKSVICTLVIILIAALALFVRLQNIFYVCSTSLTLEGILLIIGEGHEKSTYR